MKNVVNIIRLLFLKVLLIINEEIILFSLEYELLKLNNILFSFIFIEKWEWESLNTLNEEILKKFKYIAVEYNFDNISVINNKNIYYNVLKKISNTHQSFYARCNGDRSMKINFGPNRICHILEVSYIIKKGNLFTKDETIYPIYEFDYLKPQKGILETNLNVLKLFDG